MPQKKFALIFLLLNSIFINFTFSQKISEVDKIVAKYPKSFDSTEKLAERIEKDFDSDAERARAIYGWIAFNIRYDYNAYLNPTRVQGFSYSTEAEKQRKIKQLNDNLIQKAFKSKKAVCEGFTALYQHLASLMGIKCEIIRGDSKISVRDIGRKTTSFNHAWNMVLIDKKWRLIDVTWGQGYYDSSKGRMVNDFNPVYFDTDPDYFFAKHFPDSGTYLGERLSKDDFLNGPLIYNTTIEKDYKIKSPDSGIIEARNGDKITVEIKNLSKSNQVFYLNKKNQPVKVQNPKEKRGGLEFQITIDNNIGDYITVFADTNSVVSFKVVSK
ncbi:transglutaminase domain-containing protein [Flavobacterium johnsoniae]|uniref:Transglutaminase domain protein n=1 Tax=Flavobacterium johnsoniae (strain ATCC 17061 / DSM 2064 / JCM 8514 / BCRC 14874 / CCUG 350202 / NBRC 14942 / NCIMB 11054 / UW101) TaxID=376686 RepID=A5FH24_FLAJ1|nr:transglutaminase domain-containing protein [Flavobacterium johnsoniae]ABQ05498.1 transglutaminase domain protein [Flavobacterium johnsoniae UW101]OXE96772.1 transglutaminase [Flavobacterium johnsoniae UW101]WQG82700.1 transglutaminase domain-containing protein [Flavobacterium johnsoniae UW101]SHL55442.1 Transglutaminase-like superfamily protein [Flavobacterium johnsoniae]